MAPATDNAKRIEEAQKLAKSDPAKAKAIYQEVLSKDPGSSDAAVKSFETALVGLGELYRDQKKVNELAELKVVGLGDVLGRRAVTVFALIAGQVGRLCR